MQLRRSPEQISARLDHIIDEIREKWHRPAMSKAEGENAYGDVLVVAHGHSLRAFALRWACKTLQDGPTFLLEAGGVGTLRHVHGQCNSNANNTQLRTQ